LSPFPHLIKTKTLHDFKRFLVSEELISCNIISAIQYCTALTNVSDAVNDFVKAKPYQVAFGKP